MDYLVYVDGLCKRNGSSDAEAGGSLAVYRLEKGEKVDDSLHVRLARRMPLYHDSEFAVVVSEQEQATNNYAEAVSLQTAIAWLISGGLLVQGNTIHICMDSQLVLNQIVGMYKTKKIHLKKIYMSIYDMLDKHSKAIGTNAEKLIAFHWISGDVMKASVIAH
ncbi:hypothetical protein [Desulfovibrio piger]|uniref:RNase H type-1 domain-containing protein n=1 Tax=Desulfovibrio piger TaxID=901 RepID=A0A848CGN5_9BACT|nr:hypothetical protein [Desulfovibrio piger]NME52586.1 hypothetical protein [Desulfovibrio piger]